MKNERATKKDTITIRLPPGWDQYFEEVAKELEKRDNRPCSKTWVLTELMKIGLPQFEKRHNIRRKSPHID